MYYIKFYGQNADSGKMGKVEMPSGKKVPLPKNKYKRKGWKFVGWAVKRQGIVSLDELQINKVKYKNGEEVKDLAKEGKTIELYACWRGYGGEAAARWAREIAKDNSFAYGVGERAHHCGCFFCGTNRSGIKKAKKGSRWDKTYCCNPLVMASFVHGANLWEKCVTSGLTIKWWLKLKHKGKAVFKKQGRNVRYTDLRPGDVIIKNKRHIKIYVGLNKKGEPQVAHAASEGWGAKSIRVDTLKKKARIGVLYVALRYIGRS